jgi:hypothetical protein
LNETEFEGRTMKIDEARPPKPRRNGGFWIFLNRKNYIDSLVNQKY